MLGAAFDMLPRNPMPRARQRLTPTIRRSGFTLPEILIVIVLISLLALVAIPRFATANGKRHMESARMRVAAALATARQAAIQKGQTVQFKIADNRVTVITSGTTTNLISPVPLDTLYKVTVGTNISNPFTVDYSSRGFASLSSATTKIMLSRPGVSDDSVVVTSTGMVKR
jgi:prepilin-type N-terminal cleavage/methylation domain-containing protein